MMSMLKRRTLIAGFSKRRSFEENGGNTCTRKRRGNIVTDPTVRSAPEFVSEICRSQIGAKFSFDEDIIRLQRIEEQRKQSLDAIFFPPQKAGGISNFTTPLSPGLSASFAAPKASPE